jgi:serine/threonine protein kinase
MENWMLYGTQIRTANCETCFSRLVPGETCQYCRGNRSDDAGQTDVLRPGNTLNDKFKIGRLLGRGGFGATYLAWDLNLEVRTAIKEFLPRQLVSRVGGGTEVRPYTGGEAAFNAGLQQFLMEARTLAQFRDHPGIISVLDFFPANGTGYMVMEYLDGTTLDQYFNEAGPLDLSLALQLLVPVADALRACHAVGLVHRDISPDNIFLTSDQRVLVLDFGAARFAVGQQSTNLSVILKEGYAPFEQYQRNGRQGPWTDIYALTATLYRLLTGELPPPAPDRIAGVRLPPLSEKGVRAPPGLQALVDKGMAMQAEQRYRAVDDVLADLQALLPQAGRGETARIGTRTPRVANGRRKALLVGGVGVAGLVGAIAVAVALWPSPQPPQPPDRVAEIPRPPPDLAQQPGVPPTISQAVIAPPIVAPLTQPGSSLSSLREYVKQGVQVQVQLRLVATQARRALATLQKLDAIAVKSETIDRSIQAEQRLYDVAQSEQQAVLDKYMSQVEWLAEHDEASVEAAIQLESDAVHTPSVDKNEADSKTEIARAIDLLTRHVVIQRQKQLTRDAIISSLNI